MSKFDGMDPKLVRDLLGEAKRAAEELRRVEGRVGQIMTGAGLATQTTHRPAQVADAADKMVKDVTARLGVLEKRVADRDTTRPSTADPKQNGYDNPPTDTGKPEGKPDGKVEDGKPDAKTGDGKPDGKVEEGKPDAKTGDGKPDGKVEEGKPDAKTGDGKPDGKVEEGKPDAKTGDGKPDGKVEEGKPDAKTGDGKPDGKVEDGKPDAKTGDGKPDAKVEEGKPDGNVCEDDVQDRGITDTPAKDHPDDRDPSRPQVVEVDGVKVIQVPIDPPTANQLESILENLDKVQPIDMPQVDGRPGQADGYADRPPSSDQSPRNDQPIRNDPPTGSDQPIRNDPPTGSGQPARIDPPTGVAPPSGTDQPPATQPPASDGCSDNGSGRDGGISRDAQPGGQDVRDPRQDGNAERNDPPTGSDQPIRNDPPTGSDQPIRNDPPTGSGQPARIDPPTGVAPPSATDQPPATQPPASDGCSDNGSGRDGGISRDAQPGGQDVRDPRQDGNAERNDNDRQDGNAARDGSTGQDNARQDAYGGRDGNTGQDNTGQDNTGQDNARQDSVGRDGVGQGARDEGGGLVVPPTPPPDSATGTQSVGTQSPPRYDGTGVNAVPGAPAGVSAWVSDGGDVVSVNVDPPAADSIRLLVGDTRGVQPVEMPGPEMSAVEAPGAKVPGVEVLPGEWRDGVWVPEDIEPDGPRGSVDPGTPERSA